MDWKNLFIKFSSGLLDEIKFMNMDMNNMIESINTNSDCKEDFAKINQLDSDIDRMLNFVNRFFEREGLQNEQSL